MALSALLPSVVRFGGGLMAVEYDRLGPPPFFFAPGIYNLEGTVPTGIVGTVAILAQGTKSICLSAITFGSTAGKARPRARGPIDG